MVRRIRLSRLAIVPALLVLAVVSACGGDDQAGAQQDVGTLLRQTFTGDKHIRSGKLAVALDVDARGTGQVRGPLKATLSGPFQSNGARKLPSFDLAAKLSGAVQDISAGVTSTGDQGFVSFMGQPYRIDDAVWAQFKQSFESAQRKEPRKQPQS